MITTRIAVDTSGLALRARGDVSRRFTVRGDANRSVVAAVFLGETPPVDPPINDFLPTISGFVVPGFDLTAIPGVWTGATSVTGQWQRNGVDIPGETGLTYTPVQADVMQSITYVETATGPGGVVSAESFAAADTVAGFASDPGHIDIFGALPDTLSPLASGALGITAGQAVQRMAGYIYGLSGPVLSESTLANQPIYNVNSGVPGVTFDGANDRLVHQGTGLASRLAVNWSCELSVTALRSATSQPLWGTALSSSATPYQRVCNIAGSGTTPGGSTIRTSIRDDASGLSNCVVTSTRTAIGTTWALRVSARRTPSLQTLEEVQPDSGFNSTAVGAVVSQDRFAMGCFATPTAVSGYANMILHAAAYWDNGSPSAISVAASRALFTHWNMP